MNVEFTEKYYQKERGNNMEKQFINISGKNARLYQVKKNDGTLVPSLRKIRFMQKDLKNEWLSYFMIARVPLDFPQYNGAVVIDFEGFIGLYKSKFIEPIIVIQANKYTIIGQEELKEKWTNDTNKNITNTADSKLEYAKTQINDIT